MVQTQELQIVGLFGLARSVSRLMQALEVSRLKPGIPAPAVSDRFRAEASEIGDLRPATGLAPGISHYIPASLLKPS